MEKKTAFTSDFDHRTLYHTARDAREAEFDAMMLRVRNSLPAACGASEMWRAIAGCLRSNTYGSAGDSFIAAADYLREHRAVLSGITPDPQEPSQ